MALSPSKHSASRTPSCKCECGLWVGWSLFETFDPPPELARAHARTHARTFALTHTRRTKEQKDEFIAPGNILEELPLKIQNPGLINALMCVHTHPTPRTHPHMRTCSRTCTHMRADAARSDQTPYACSHACMQTHPRAHPSLKTTPTTHRPTLQHSTTTPCKV